MYYPFTSFITLYFKITRSIFYVGVIFLSVLTTLLLIQFPTPNIQIFIIALCAVICVFSFLYVLRLWHYRIELEENSLIIHGFKTTVIPLSQIEKINERTVNGFMHINLYLKGRDRPQFKLYEYLDCYDELRAFLFANYPYAPH